MIRSISFTIGAIVISPVSTQGTETPKSLRVFIQNFYDLYPSLNVQDPHTRSYKIALQKYRYLFDPTLAKSLLDEFDAQPCIFDIGEWDDPFFNPEAGGNSYRVGSAIKTKNGFLVNIHGVDSGRVSSEPVIIIEVRRSNGHWLFSDFIFPGGKGLLSTLSTLRDDRKNKIPK